MTRLLGAACGASVVAGVLLMIVGVQPAPPASPLRRPNPARTAVNWLLRVGAPEGTQTSSRGWAAWRWPVAVVGGFAVLLLSGWPVAAVLVVIAVVGLPILLATGTASQVAIAKAEAIQEWTRRLSDVLVVGVGLEQAITATTRACPALLEPAVTALAGRLTARHPVEQALRQFADDLDDSAADIVAATLILGSRRRGPGLARVLTSLADSLADEVAMRRKVEAERAKPRTTARAVTLITLAVTLVAGLNGSYLRPYGTPFGQLVLAVLSGSYIGALWWMHSMTRAPASPRILAGLGVEREGAQP